jgi:hypothetical protein
VVQVGETAGEQFYFSTMWFYEDGAWRLAAFFAKPGSIGGADWTAFAESAAAERLAKRDRNAALLYNVAIDLSVPAAWMKPAAVAELQRQQRRIRVSNLPRGSADVWRVAEADSFSVLFVEYTVQSDDLGLVVTYAARHALSDSVAVAEDTDRLAAFIRREFPEYGKVFPTVTIRALDTVLKDRSWFRVYPLREDS